MEWLPVRGAVLERLPESALVVVVPVAVELVLHLDFAMAGVEILPRLFPQPHHNVGHGV